MTARTAIGRRVKNFSFPSFPALSNWQLSQWQKTWKGLPKDWPKPEKFANLEHAQRKASAVSEPVTQ